MSWVFQCVHKLSASHTAGKILITCKSWQRVSSMRIKIYIVLDIRYWYNNSWCTENVYAAVGYAQEIGWIFLLPLVRSEVPKTAAQVQIFEITSWARRLIKWIVMSRFCRCESTLLRGFVCFGDNSSVKFVIHFPQKIIFHLILLCQGSPYSFLILQGGHNMSVGAVPCPWVLQ